MTARPDVTAETSRCPADDPTCVDLLTAQALWWIEEPWEVWGIDGVGDVNGDGVADVALNLIDELGDQQHSSIVFGPFARALTLPSEEDVGLPNSVIAAELTGDGISDLIAEGGAVLQGPIPAGATVADAVGTVPLGGEGAWTERLDVDSDGDLDLILPSHDHIDVWTGPWTTWSTDPPTLSLSVPQCPDNNDATTQALLRPVPDVDLDGVPELWVTSCGWYRIPADLVGAVDVPASFSPAPDLPVPFAYGDQDGDGHDDFLHSYRDADGAWAYEVLSPPLVEGPTGWSGVRLGAVPLDAFYGQDPYPIGAWVLGDGWGDPDEGSVVGDAHHDFGTAAWFPDLGVDGELLVAGGPNGGLLTGEVALRVLGSDLSTAHVTYVEGVALAEEDRYVRVYDLN